MAPNVTLHFFANNDLNGDVIEEITDEDPRFMGLKLKLDRDSLGGAELRLQRKKTWGLSQLAGETFVRVLVHAYSDTVYYPWPFFLNKRDLTVVHRDESGAEVLVFGGAGPKMYLSRHALGIVDHLSDGGWHLDLDNGIWRWTEDATVGGILRRIILEDQARGDPALPDLTFTFDFNDDSNGNPWTDTALAGGSDQDYEIPVGTSLLQALWDLDDVVELSSWVDVGTVASPKFELNVIEGTRDDNTGSAFGAGVCLLKEGVNIANDALVLQGKSIKKASHVIVEGKDGKWEVAEKPSFSPGDYVKYAKIEYGRSSKLSVLQKAGERWLRRQDHGEKEIEVDILPGASDATGLYFPAPNRVLWLDNLISVDTSTDGTAHSVIDLDPADEQLVTGFDLELGKAGDTASADSKAKSWNVNVKLNINRPGTVPGTPDQRSAASGGGNNCRCLHFPPDCTPSSTPGGYTVDDTLIDTLNDIGWNSNSTAGACWGGLDHVLQNGTGGASPLIAVSAGDELRAAINVKDETGDDPWEDVENYSYEFVLDLEGSGQPLIRTYIMHERFHNAGCIDVERELFATVPTGYTGARIRTLPRLGGYKFNATLQLITITDPSSTECPPFSNDDQGGSPYAVRSDDPRLDAPDQHPTTRLTALHVNNSGGALNPGDVVIADSTFDGTGITTTTDAAQSAQRVGVVLDAMADGESGYVIWEGRIDIPINLDGAPATELDYLFTSATAGAGDVSATRAEGAVGQVIRITADNETGYVQWWGVPDTGSGGGGGGAPTTADYLVGTAQGGLSAEIVVGTTPGGELGGTWASPTVDATHSGSAHHTENHASRHSDGGADAVDITALDGFPGGTTQFLRADGTFAGVSGGASGTTRVVKTADEIVNNSAALQDDNHLVLAVDANKRYGWRVNLWFMSGTTPDIQWEFTVPTGATGQFAGMGLGTGAADNEGPTYAYGAGVAGPDDAGQGVSVVRHRRFEGFLKTSGTAGNLQLRWAQNSANASDTTLLEGSSLEIWEL